MLCHRRFFSLYLKEIVDAMEDRATCSLRSESGGGHPPVIV